MLGAIGPLTHFITEDLHEGLVAHNGFGRFLDRVIGGGLRKIGLFLFKISGGEQSVEFRRCGSVFGSLNQQLEGFVLFSGHHQKLHDFHHDLLVGGIGQSGLIIFFEGLVVFTAFTVGGGRRVMGHCLDAALHIGVFGGPFFLGG